MSICVRTYIYCMVNTQHTFIHTYTHTYILTQTLHIYCHIPLHLHSYAYLQRLQPYMIISPSPLKHQIIAQNKVFARLQTRCSTVRQYITISATFTWSGICNRYQAIAILLTLTGSCQVPELLVCNQCSGFDEGFLENVSIGRFDSLVIMLLCFHYFESKLLVEIQCTVIVNLYM